MAFYLDVRREIRPTHRDVPCTCLLASEEVGGFGEHLVREHDEEPCSGTWGWDPPCGGCINCILAQVHYYAEGTDDTP